MSGSPDDTSGAAALALTRQLQTLLGPVSLDVAFEALGNTLVLLAVVASNSRAEAHAVIDEEWEAVHHCLEANYEFAARLHAEQERHGAVVH